MEILDVQGFKFPDSQAARWVLASKDIKWISGKSLLAKFYEEYQWGREPLGWEQNPVDKEGHPYFDPTVSQDVIVAPYRRNFYITIQRSFNAIFGPHVVRLMYRSWQVQGEFAWVAILQISAMWHSKDKLKTAMLEAIDRKEFYQCNDTQEEFVLF